MSSRLELRAVTKRYAGLVANDAVSLEVEPGEIHAILGENGAGKSTLMKIIGGSVQADAGTILWHGQAVTIPDPAAGRRLGIAMVHQHFSLFETISVVENIAVALDDPFNLKTLSERINRLGAQYGLPVDPARSLHDLSVGERQRVEILRCLLQDPRLLILDEPTSVLTPQAAQRLFAVLRQLAARGCAILYISHKLDEIRNLCDRATVLRAGRVVGRARPAEVTAEELARMMVGSTVPALQRLPPDGAGQIGLSLRRLSSRSIDPFGMSLDAISVEVRCGEILGIAGISGNGQAELAAALSGEARVAAAMIELGGRGVGDLGVAGRRDLGLAFVPEERLGRGAVPDFDLLGNALLTGHRQGLVRRGFVDRAAVAAFAARVIDEFGVKCRGPGSLARSLSGGNLQKFIVGREMSLAPRVLIVCQPTWGVDVAAAAVLRQGLIDISRRGTAVLVMSEELDELFEICDRLAVIHRGRLSQVRSAGQWTTAEIGLFMAGSGFSAAEAA